MQKTTSVSGLREQIAEIIADVSSGKHSYTILKNGKPVAKIVSADAHVDLSPAFANLVDTVFKDFAHDLQQLVDTP